MNNFEDLGLSKTILTSLHDLGYETPTPIQRDAIPLVLRGSDVMGLAQTGTGKTAAFGLPIVHHLLAMRGRPAPKTCKALVLAPTRELVNQIAESLRTFVRRTPVRVATVVGGASIGGQIQTLARGTDILVATPGRLIDLLDRRAVFLDQAKLLVLDEADQMLDMGFIPALKRIAPLVGKPRQTLLFSATMPKQIADLSASFQTDPIRVEAAAPGTAADKVRQTVHFVQGPEKVSLLKGMLSENPADVSLVFARTKHGAENLMKRLAGFGLAVDSIHGNKSQGQRDRAIKAFKTGKIRVLVATDVAARGIDIPSVSHVYNYDLPDAIENYIHRIGRTARAGREGEAVAFCAPKDAQQLRRIEKLLGFSIETAGGTRPDGKPAHKQNQRRSSAKRKRPQDRGQADRPARAPEARSPNERKQRLLGETPKPKQDGDTPSAAVEGRKRPKNGSPEAGRKKRRFRKDGAKNRAA